MGPTDARRLSAESLADLRRRVVAAVEGGMTQIEAARVFGVSRRAVGVWVRAHRVAGEAAFRPNRRGRTPGDQFALPLPAQARVLDVLASGPPDAAGLEHPLWARRAVAALVDREYGLRLSPTTVGQYLARWGLAPEHAPPRGPHSGPALPGAEWEAMVRADWVGRPRAREVLRVAWTRPASSSLGAMLLPDGDLELLVATTSRGASAFALRRGPYTAADAEDFGDRLVRHVGRGVHVVVCAWPAEHVEALRAWRDGRPDGPVRVSIY